jgi:hypothetical protein
LLSCSPRVAVRPGGEIIVGLLGLTAEWGALWLTPPWLWVFVHAPRIHSDLPGWLVQSGLGRFLFISAVLGQLARWFYPSGSGAHCNNNYYRYMVTASHGLGGQTSHLSILRPAETTRHLGRALPYLHRQLPRAPAGALRSLSILCRSPPPLNRKKSAKEAVTRRTAADPISVRRERDVCKSGS